MDWKYKEINSFTFSIVCAVILLLEVTGKSSATQNLDDELIIPFHGTDDDQENSHCCRSELLKLKNELDSVKENFRLYKESQLETIYFIPERVELIAKAIIDKQTEMVTKHMNFLQDHILNSRQLEKISQQIIAFILERSNLTTTLQIFSTSPFLQKFSPMIQLEFLESLFDNLDTLGHLENSSSLKQMVELMKKIFMKVKDANGNQNLSPSWSKETEVRLVHRLTVNLLNHNHDDRKWSDAINWFNPGIFCSFPLLSEHEVYDVILDTFETHFEDSLLTKEQLVYINQLYYQSFDCGPSFGFWSPTLWNQRKKVFSRQLIFNSIDRDILSRVTTNLMDATTIGLNYLKNEFDKSNWNYEDDMQFDADDVWFTHVVDVFLHTMQSGSMTYDPKEPDFWKIIGYFGNAQTILSKYPFVEDEVKSIIFDTYDHQRINFTPALEFIRLIPRSLKLVGIKQLLSLMRENNHLTNGHEIFQLANFMMTFNFQNQSIWNEIPVQVQLISDYSNHNKGLLWFLKSSDEAGEIRYEIFANSQFKIGLKSLRIEDESVNEDDPVEDQQQIDNETIIKNIWIFDTTVWRPVGSGNPVRTQISLYETSPVHGGVVVGSFSDNDTHMLRHVVNFKDRRNGKFATFHPVLSSMGETFQLHFGGDSFVSVQKSEDDEQPIGLVMKSRVEPSFQPAEFALQRIQ